MSLSQKIFLKSLRVIGTYLLQVNLNIILFESQTMLESQTTCRDFCKNFLSSHYWVLFKKKGYLVT